MVGRSSAHFQKQKQSEFVVSSEAYPFVDFIVLRRLQEPISRLCEEGVQKTRKLNGLPSVLRSLIFNSGRAV